MRTIETVVVVGEHGVATLRVPPDVPPGEHRVVMVMEEAPSTRPKLDMNSFPRHEVGPWPFGPTETFRREDLYDDDGR